MGRGIKVSIVLFLERRDWKGVWLSGWNELHLRGCRSFFSHCKKPLLALFVYWRSRPITIMHAFIKRLAHVGLPSCPTGELLAPESLETAY